MLLEKYSRNFLLWKSIENDITREKLHKQFIIKCIENNVTEKYTGNNLLLKYIENNIARKML